MVQQKVQLREEDPAFIERACEVLRYRSKSEYMRLAIEAKMRADRRRLRELQRRQATAGYAGDLEVAFHEIEAEDFDER